MLAGMASTSKPSSRSSLSRRLELVGAPGRDRQPVAVLTQRPGDGQADAAGSSCDERRAVPFARDFILLSFSFPCRGGIDRTRGRARRLLDGRLRRLRRRRATQAPPPATAAGLPDADGKSLARADARSSARGPVLAPSGSRVRAGQQPRSASVSSTRARKQITDASVALYVGAACGGPAKGPYPARYESLDGEAAVPEPADGHRPRRRQVDLRGDVPFKKPGRYEVLGIVALDDKLVAATRRRPASSSRTAANRSGRPPWAARPADAHADQGDVGGDVARSTRALPPRRCTTPTSPTCSARSRSCSCSRRRSSARAASAARSSTSPSR